MDKNECPNVYRITRANEIMNEGDPEPPHLYRKSVLRVAKHEAAMSKHIDKNPVKALELMQLSPSYKKIFHFFALNPLIIHYWLNYQIHIYNNYWKENDACLSIDATGGIARKIIRSNREKSNAIFFYECVVNSNSDNTVWHKCLQKLTMQTASAFF